MTTKNNPKKPAKNTNNSASVGMEISMPPDLYAKVAIIANRLGKLEGRNVSFEDAFLFVLRDSVSTPNKRTLVKRLNAMILN